MTFACETPRMKIVLRHSDCLDLLDELETDCIEMIVSDPPYDLKSSLTGGFRGEKWDGTGIAFSQEFWGRLFRVTRPGGVVKVFGGTRTFHRMCGAIETAGFVLMPPAAWGYSVAMPKSLDVSKAIDKHAGIRMYFEIVRDHIRHWRDERGLTNRDLNVAVGSSLTGSGMVRHWTSKSGTQHSIPSKDQWAKLKDILKWPDCALDQVYDFVKDGATRPGTGEFLKRIEPAAFAGKLGGKVELRIIERTSAATSEAARWNGWGTALRPSWEVIIVAHKPHHKQRFGR